MERIHHKLTAWRVARKLVKDVYTMTASFPAEERYGLVVQMRRSVVSIPSNIAEGAARATPREFRHFLTIARGSLAELETQIMIASDLSYTEESNRFNDSMGRLFGLLGGLIKQQTHQISKAGKKQ